MSSSVENNFGQEKAVGQGINSVTALAIEEKCLERVAIAICKACDEDPFHKGDARGNDYRWEDYLTIADAAMLAMKEP